MDELKQMEENADAMKDNRGVEVDQKKQIEGDISDYNEQIKDEIKNLAPKFGLE